MEEILKKESWTESDIKVLIENNSIKEVPIASGVLGAGVAFGSDQMRDQEILGQDLTKKARLFILDGRDIEVPCGNRKSIGSL